MRLCWYRCAFKKRAEVWCCWAFCLSGCRRRAGCFQGCRLQVRGGCTEETLAKVSLSRLCDLEVRRPEQTVSPPPPSLSDPACPPPAPPTSALAPGSLLRRALASLPSVLCILRAVIHVAAAPALSARPLLTASICPLFFSFFFLNVVKHHPSRGTRFASLYIYMHSGFVLGFMQIKVLS